MKHYAILYIATLVVMTILDLAWIGGIARDFYKSRLGEQMDINAIPAVMFYLIYIVGIMIFVHGMATQGWQSTMLYGALFGFFCYATYDMTNLATLRGWSQSLTIVDMAWGTFVTGAAATAGKLITDYFERA